MWDIVPISPPFFRQGGGTEKGIGMFLGEFTHKLDSKGRLTIPTKFRGRLAQGLVVTRGLDPCLAIYPLEEWQQLSAKVSALPITDRVARAFRRLVFAGASFSTLDGQGRVLIPPRLREEAGLDGEVIITGLDTYIELWSPENWEAEQARVVGDEEMWAALEI